MKRYRLLLLGLIVIGTLLSSFHYHADGSSHSDCQVCTVQFNLDSAGEITSYTLANINTKLDENIAFQETYPASTLNLNTLSRAPPSFS